MKLIDTHTHLYDEAFDNDRDQTVERAREAGVTTLLCPAIDALSYDALFRFVRHYPGAYAMMGLHPTSVNDNPQWGKDLEQVAHYLAQPPEGIHWIGIGEVGLDFYWSRDFIAEQTEALRFQIELALQYELPLVLHTRDAWDEMCDLLEEYRDRGLRGVLHSFSGNKEHYLRLKRLGGFRFGIGGPVTYKKSKLAALIPHMDLSDLLLETDSPYLPPVPHRGQRNESCYLPLICIRIAELLNIPPETVAETTYRNTIETFNLSL